MVFWMGLSVGFMGYWLRSSNLGKFLLVWCGWVELRWGEGWDLSPAAASVSPSVRYYLLLEYCNRNAGNLPQNVKDQCSAVKKELKDVILFPKDSKGQSQVMHR
jgi:hypothetical protein